MSSNDTLVGTTLGAYRVNSLLGTGGMGEVYHGVHETIHRPVAIKVLKPAIAADKATLARFFDEARAVNVIRHENIVEVTDLVTEVDDRGDPMRSYMVMELLEGRTLTDAIRQARKLEPVRVVRIAAQIADAIAAAHTQDIIHRDLKPDNVFLIQRQGTADYVKILDFGIARLRPDMKGSQATKTGVVIGTPAYMSPEQVEGKPATKASDIYSLGVIMFHMLTGRIPFEGPSMAQVMFGHMNKPAPSVRERAPDVPEALARIVAQTLVKPPEQRPAGMLELGAALCQAVGIDPGPSSTELSMEQRRAHASAVSSVNRTPGSKPPAPGKPHDSRASESLWGGATVDITGQARASRVSPPRLADAGAPAPQPDPGPEISPDLLASAGTLAATPRAAAEAAMRALAPSKVPPGGVAGSLGPRLDDPGASESGLTDPGARDPGASDPGASDPGASDPGLTERPLLVDSAVHQTGQDSQTGASGDTRNLRRRPVAAKTLSTEPLDAGGKSRVGLIIGGLAVVAVIAGIGVVIGMGGDNKTERAAAADAQTGDVKPAATPARALRQGLTRAASSHNEPAPPRDCQTRDPALLEQLTEVTRLLGDGKPGGARPDDRAAVNALSGAAPDAAEYWYWLAKARLYAGQEDASVLTAVDRAVSACAGYAAAHSLRGTVLFRAGQHADAEKHYRKALDLDSGFTIARYNLGLVQLQTKRTDDAIASFTDVIAKEPDNAAALVGRGLAHLSSGDVDAAASDLKRATEISPEPTANAFWLLGQAQRKQGKDDEANQAFCAAADLGHEQAKRECKK